MTIPAVCLCSAREAMFAPLNGLWTYANFYFMFYLSECEFKYSMTHHKNPVTYALKYNMFECSFSGVYIVSTYHYFFQSIEAHDPFQNDIWN